MLACSDKSIGLLLQPEFTYKKNQLWMLENLAMKDLAGAGISLDKSWILMFKEKAGQCMHRSRSLRDCELEYPDQMICRWMPETACGLSTTEAASLKVRSPRWLPEIMCSRIR